MSKTMNTQGFGDIPAFLKVEWQRKPGAQRVNSPYKYMDFSHLYNTPKKASRDLMGEKELKAFLGERKKRNN